jgi:2-C-methyl-D-erythritol 2,4-cyclodiphosphate synthase
MTNFDEINKSQLAQEIASILARKQHLAFASDFHSFKEGRQLTLAGVKFENFSKGPDTKRSDGDVVAHAIVMALAGATNTGDIDDWFPDKGEIDVKSMEYLPEMRQRLIEKEHLLLGTVDVTILCGEKPRMKRHIPEMQINISKGLGIDIDQVQVKVSSMDGKDEIARLEGIEARVLISLWKGL